MVVIAAISLLLLALILYGAYGAGCRDANDNKSKKDTFAVKSVEIRAGFPYEYQTTILYDSGSGREEGFLSYIDTTKIEARNDGQNYASITVGPIQCKCWPWHTPRNDNICDVGPVHKNATILVPLADLAAWQKWHEANKARILKPKRILPPTK